MHIVTNLLPFSADMLPSSWQVVTLGEVCSEINDGDWIEIKDQGGNDFRLLQISNIGVGAFVETGNYRYVTQETFFRLRCREIVPGQILVSRMPDPVGRAWYVQPMPFKAITAVDVAILTPNPLILDGKYCSYYLNSPQNIAYAQSRASGTTRLRITRRDLETFPIPLPPLPVQRKIAAVLSAYDDLIESNTRRIRILEQMARTIYREWFGKADPASLPEGWEMKTLDYVLSEIESGSRPKGGIDPNQRGIPSIGAENIIGLGKYNYASEKYVSADFYNAMTRGHIKNKDVLIYKDGASIGRKSMFRDGFPHNECCINEHVFILRTNEKCTQNFLYFWLDLPDMTQNIKNLNANAAQPGINQAGVKGLPILLPDEIMLKKLDDVIDPMMGLLFNLAKKNANLQRTRDLLLPRLVSGEVRVDEVEIVTGEI